MITAVTAGCEDVPGLSRLNGHVVGSQNGHLHCVAVIVDPIDEHRERALVLDPDLNRRTLNARRASACLCSACVLAGRFPILRNHPTALPRDVRTVGHEPGDSQHRAGTLAALPTGSVTFRFTDIEGSTQRWDAHPDAMRAALERHDTLMRQAIEAHAGQVFKTVGDAFCAAFATTGAGLAAAIAAQRAIATEDGSAFGQGCSSHSLGCLNPVTPARIPTSSNSWPGQCA